MLADDQNPSLQAGELIVLLQHRQSLGDVGLAEFAQTATPAGARILVLRSGEAPLTRELPPAPLDSEVFDERIAPPDAWPDLIGELDSSTIRAIVTNDEYLLQFARDLCDRFAINCVLPSRLDQYRDKSAMHSAFEDARLPVPRSVTEGQNPRTIFASQERVIVKPRREANLRGIFTATPGELEGTDLSDKVVEEFLDGPQYHCELLVRGGTATPLFAGRYVNPLLDLAAGGISGSVEIREEVGQRLCELAVTACEVLGTDGEFVAHAEFLSRGEGASEIVLGEVCARAPGGEIPFQSRIVTGIDLEAANLCLQAGVEPHVDEPQNSRSAGWLWSSKSIDVGSSAGDGYHASVHTEVGRVPLGHSVRIFGETPELVQREADRIIAKR